ncbi:putative lipoprotein [Streptomyces alanosinicus]|uniref:Lipoprotein n=2 Tax=Streptomyces alanosinicus TaxID=68171 RepID=A0A919D196_9ACTN|nr:putative lipoprotein [Streptomyces alanosinicus]
MVVHGEREMLPSATRAEAAKAVTAFTAAYNKADKAFDSSLDAPYLTGPFGDITAARLKAGHTNSPSGNPNHVPLKLSDVKITIPKKAGWPRWFVADAQGNKTGRARWLMVFTRGDLGARWRVAYVTLVAPGAVPRFTTDKDGWAQAVPAGSAQLAVTPGKLSAEYATYLKKGGQGFADGSYTSVERADRAKRANKPGLVTQFIDRPLTSGDYAPLALRTEAGGALVFFTTHHYEKQTAAAGTTVPVPNKDVRALTKGEVNQSLTLEFMSAEVALDPTGSGKVSVLGRVPGLTAAQGS